jgi:hypothetical protein
LGATASSSDYLGQVLRVDDAGDFALDVIGVSHTGFWNIEEETPELLLAVSEPP